MTLDELEWAKKVLNIEIPATLMQIEKKYKDSIKSFHPDVSGADAELSKQKAAELNRAIGIVRDYCRHYRFDFSEEQFYDQYPEERIRKMYWKDVRPDKQA